MSKIICYLQTIWHTTTNLLGGGNAIIEGHTYKNEEVLLDRVVFVDKCIHCGAVSISHSDRVSYEVMKKEGKL